MSTSRPPARVLAGLLLLAPLSGMACGGHGSATTKGAGAGTSACHLDGDCTGYDVCVAGMCVPVTAGSTSSGSTAASSGGAGGSGSSGTLASSSGGSFAASGSASSSASASSGSNAATSSASSSGAGPGATSSSASASSSGCVPSCAGRQCGDDGCNGSCGTCAFACSSGTCTGVCSPGATMCDQNNVLSCQSNGQWETIQTCNANQTCSNSQCVAACSTETFQLVNNVANGAGICSSGQTYALKSMMYVNQNSNPGTAYDIFYLQYATDNVMLGSSDAGQYQCCMLDPVGCVGYTQSCPTTQGTFPCLCLGVQNWSVTANACGTQAITLCQ